MQATLKLWAFLPTFVTVSFTVLEFSTVMLGCVEPLFTPPTANAVSLTLRSTVLVPPTIPSWSSGWQRSSLSPLSLLLQPAVSAMAEVRNSTLKSSFTSEEYRQRAGPEYRTTIGGGWGNLAVPP